MLRHFTAAAALAFALAASAFAEDEPNPPPTEGVPGMAGQFAFAQADGKSRGCLVILHEDEIADALYKVELADDCVEQFEFLNDVGGWDRKDDGFVIFDSNGGQMFVMEPDAAEPSIYRGRNQTDSRDYYMERVSG